MQEKIKQNVSSILERLKSRLNLVSDTELAEKLNLNSSSIIYNWRRRDTLDYRLILDFCVDNHIDLTEIITGMESDSLTPSVARHMAAEPVTIYEPQFITINQNNQDVITIVPHKAAAGYLNGYSDPEFIENLPTISAPGFTNGIFRGFEIRGNSMLPLHPGSYNIGRLVVQLSDIRNRRVYIIVSKDDGIVIKRVINIPHDQKLVLLSDNPNKKEYPNYTIDHAEVLQIWEWRGALITSIPDPSILWDRLNDYEARITYLESKYRTK